MDQEVALNASALFLSGVTFFIKKRDPESIKASGFLEPQRPSRLRESDEAFLALLAK